MITCIEINENPFQRNKVKIDIVNNMTYDINLCSKFF